MNKEQKKTTHGRVVKRINTTDTRSKRYLSQISILLFFISRSNDIRSEIML